MEHIRVMIPFREDFNGRPICYSFENFVVLRTHPFYCWSSTKYGRVYRYNILDKATKVIRNDFEIYCYDLVSLLFDRILDNFIMDILTNEICDEKIYKYDNFFFKLVKTNDYDSETLISKIENGDNLDNKKELIHYTDFERANRCLLSCVLQCGNYEKEPDDFYGFVRTTNGIYLIVGDFENIFKCSDKNSGKQNTEKHQATCESSEQGIIDIYFTPIKQN
ncbi:hypothetical protein QJ854_gp138 [Moumouvirus goulette]|uniref:Uncharacterized protein n=1 Tax=Moumouvirus goulette TaxID=1247379 RepID=M1PCE4_9VIRU|nr:hypothetical protein QJ854_gp138 [Moumouvirus goulette]AGF85644.1 hypothetical protein glt_00839 [Moumouvirus goulette]